MPKKESFQTKKIVLGLIVAAACVIASVVLVDMSVKRAIICTGLSLVIGACIAFPAWDERINYALLAAYLLYVPNKTFERIELPFHDLTRLVSGVTLLSVWFILCIYLICFLLTQHVNLALGVGNIVLIVLFLVEYYVYKFRGYVVTPSDVLAVGTAMTVMSHYDYSLSSEAFYTVLYLLAFMMAGFRISVPLKGRKYVRLAASAVSAVAVGAFLCLTLVSDYLEDHDIVGHYWNMAENQLLNGTFISFISIYKDMKMEVPQNYSEESVQALADAYRTEGNTTEQVRPNIIMIMNEAWSDLSVLGDLEITEDDMPFLNSLEGDVIRGNLHVSIWGGLTANTEFEALTGDSLSLLSPTVVPYSNQLNHAVYGLPEVLKAQGYYTMAMHPSGSGVWGRNEAYEYLGFDEFISVDKFQTEYEYLRGFISDECNFNEIIWQYEHRDTDSPFFLFDVTIQNHSDYYGEIDMPIGITSVNGTPASEAGYLYDVQTYVNLMKITDESFEMLIEYFEQVDEPVIVCMFGDHQPIFSDSFYDMMFEGQDLTELEESMLTHITPYVIWANYDLDDEEYGDFSANYLPAVLTECAGLESTPYYSFLLNEMQEYPVLSVAGCMDSSGNLSIIDDLDGEEAIDNYRIFQYNHLYSGEASAENYLPSGTAQ